MQGQVIQQRSDIANAQIEKSILMEAMVSNDAGVLFLQWLCSITNWNKPLMCNEDAARRDIWLVIRRHIPVEKLALIEYEDLRNEQQLVKELLRPEILPETGDQDATA